VGHDKRASWESYAPLHGNPNNYGTIGCPGGGDWCYASSFGAATPISGAADVNKRAANVAAALAGLGSGVGGAVDVGLSIGPGANASVAPALPSASFVSGSSVSGDDVREARPSYAPYAIHEGRVGALGEIGAGGVGVGSGSGVGVGAGSGVGSGVGVGGPPPARSVMSSGKQVGRPKTYALGSWKK